MDSTTTTKTPNILTTLGFDALAPGISYYQPNINATRSADQAQDPTLIILCSWAFAQPKHIAKYLQPYQLRYPAAEILLIQNNIVNAIWKPDTWQYSFFQPAAIAVQDHIAHFEHHRILMHTFSNGGAHASVQLSETCRATCGGMKLSIDALILDSCPGQPRFMPTIHALAGGVPSKNPLAKSFGTFLAYVSVGGTALLDLLDIAEPAAWKLYRRLNDPADSFLFKVSGGVTKAIPRTYLFSEADTMILAEDVRGHARIAGEKMLAAGFDSNELGAKIQLEEFVGTAHVNHVKTEGERYWEAVEATWEKAYEE